MQTTRGDIFKLARRFDWIVVPTNQGWTKDGRGILGKGLALQAAARWPNLITDWGDYCMKALSSAGPLPVRCRGGLVILAPTKSLDEKAPWLSWRTAARISTIEETCLRLQQLVETGLDGERILVPDLGCGEGGLLVEVVRPVLHRLLAHERFIHVAR
jgi:hypothetical protein